MFGGGYVSTVTSGSNDDARNSIPGIYNIGCYFKKSLNAGIIRDLMLLQTFCPK